MPALARDAITLLRKLSIRNVPYRVITVSPLEDVLAIRDASHIRHFLPNNIIITAVDSSDRHLALLRVLKDLPGGKATLLVDDQEANIVDASRIGILTARVDAQPASCATVADFCIHGVHELESHVTFEGPIRQV
jgi:hypothetical protein